MGMQTHHILSQEERDRLDAIALYFERERAREKLLAQVPTYSRVPLVSTQSTPCELSTQSVRQAFALYCEHDRARSPSVGTTLPSLAAYRTRVACRHNGLQFVATCCSVRARETPRRAIGRP